MKAAVIHEFGKPLSIDEVAKPEPTAGEVVFKTEASGLCHTDIHTANGDLKFKPKLPIIPGHEAVGIVESVGAGVTNIKPGDRVALPEAQARTLVEKGAADYVAVGMQLEPAPSTDTSMHVGRGDLL